MLPCFSLWLHFCEVVRSSDAKPTCKERLLALAVHPFPWVMFLNVDFTVYLALFILHFVLFSNSFFMYISAQIGESVGSQRPIEIKWGQLYLFICLFIFRFMMCPVTQIVAGKKRQTVQTSRHGRNMMLWNSPPPLWKLSRLVEANFPYKEIGRVRFSQQERKKLRHRNQHGSQISALKRRLSICAPIGEKRQIFSFNLIWAEVPNFSI